MHGANMVDALHNMAVDIYDNFRYNENPFARSGKDDYIQYKL